jgi:hypothetical protein
MLTYADDLGRCASEADAHQKAFQALIDGLERYSRTHSDATDGRVATTGLQVLFRLYSGAIEALCRLYAGY